MSRLPDHHVHAMALNADAQRYADLLHADALEHLASDLRQHLARIDDDYAWRGITAATPRFNEIRLARVQHAEKAAIARIDATLKAHREFGIRVSSGAIASLIEATTESIDQAGRLISSDLGAQLQASGMNGRSIIKALQDSVRQDVNAACARVVRQLEILQLEQRTRQATGLALDDGLMSHDIFLSHAGADKQTIARVLKEALEAAGHKVWFDEAELTLGDSLRTKIDEGLRTCRFGIVLLSPAFFGRQWTTAELDGLSAREVRGVKVILPVVHNLTHEELVARSPSLAGRLYVRIDEGIDAVVASVSRAIEASMSSMSRLPPERPRSSEDIDQTQQELSITIKGVWWSFHDHAFPMYVRMELSHADKDPDVVKRVFLKCIDRTIEPESVDRDKVRELKAPDFKDLVLKFFPGGSGRVESMRLVIETVRNKRAEAVFEASPSGWWPTDLWKGFPPY